VNPLQTIFIDSVVYGWALSEWQARQQTRAAVQSTIRFALNELPEEPYPESLWDKKVDAVWAYVFSRPQQRQAGAALH
jgi:type I restriction enzyme, R subunit